MSKKTTALFLAATSLLMIAGLLSAQDLPLIPRQILFGNPVKSCRDDFA